MKDVAGIKFIVFLEHAFRGQYLVLGHGYAGVNKRLNLISSSKKYYFDIKMLTYVNILKSLISVVCERRYRHIEIQSNHVLTGAHVSNQSTNGGIRQQ